MQRSDSLNARSEIRGQQLLLVRHSAPSILDDMSYRDWPLSDKGNRLTIRAARYVAGFKPRLICSSDERKAIETARIIAQHCGVDVEIEPGLREHDRTGVRWCDAATRQRELKALFASPNDVVFGRESAEQALQRLTSAIDQVLAQASGTSVLVTHGTVMALYLSRLTGRAALAIWSQLGLPSVAVVDRCTHRLVDLVTDFGPDAREGPETHGAL